MSSESDIFSGKLMQILFSIMFGCGIGFFAIGYMIMIATASYFSFYGTGSLIAGFVLLFAGFFNMLISIDFLEMIGRSRREK